MKWAERGQQYPCIRNRIRLVAVAGVACLPSLGLISRSSAEGRLQCTAAWQCICMSGWIASASAIPGRISGGGGVGTATTGLVRMGMDDSCPGAVESMGTS